ncbi:ferrochelatase [Reinekea marina]|uniref:Ferrochelatase n=1 Tax=Reinekea marina TaxID=1310421 RepID=A0ABV7WW33_9GAMM|nr:ferrochelatase [Reinekea marina]MDN3647419.1 ferrochelatase [Reinekea marina]
MKHFPVGHPDVKFGRIGVVLVNLGTPDDLSPKSVRRYLKEFLSDSRVVEIPKLLWWPLLNGIILNTRPKKSAQAYRKIWLHDINESPLRHYTQQQAEKLAHQMPEVDVVWAMRYGQPSISTALTQLQAKGCDRIVVFPMYPQYSATTNATVSDAVFDHLKTLRWQPTVRIAHPWYRQEAYINAIAALLKARLNERESAPEKIIMSFHGLPERFINQGDPYQCHCFVTRRLIAEAIGWSLDDVLVTFQSRFGKAKWIEPYTNATLTSLAEEGVKDILVLTPGFVVDCLETLEEIAMEGKEVFEEAGGTHYDVLPCLNDSGEAMDMIEQLVKAELSGWEL